MDIFTQDNYKGLLSNLSIFSPAPLPANVHWEPSSYENWDADDGSKTKTDSSSDKAFNTFSWPSNTWATNTGARGTDSQWMKDVRSQVKRKVQTKVVTDIIVVLEKFSEVEHKVYVRNQRRADMKYKVTLDQEGHYVVKSVPYVDASPMYFWDKKQRCNFWERVA